MSETKECMECGATETSRFRSLTVNKLKEAEAYDLLKVTWKKNNYLCHSCYMNCVENQLRRLKREAKRPKVSVEEAVTNVDVAEDDDVIEVDIDDIIKEEIENKIKEVVELRDVETIMREDIEAVDEEEGLNTLANICITTTARAVDRKKKKISETHKEYVEKAFKNCSENSFLLNIDDYYNIHTPRQQPDTTDTSWAAHMATIITNLCPIPAIPRNGALNPKIVDDELIMKHLDERFMANLGISYYDRIKGKGSNDDLIEKLTLHSYDDRLAEKKSDRHIQNDILFDFVESNLKSVENYTKALQIVHDQKPMGEYLSNHVIPIVADWPGQFFIRKAIAHRILLNNEVIPRFVAAFLLMMGPLHISLNSRELVFDKYSLLFNDIYKGIFGENKVFVDFVYLKFGNACKNIEFLYLTDFLSNLIPLVLDVYAVHHREGNWPAYEEACMCCWSDLFLRFDRKNYKRAPLMFFSDIFFWMDTNHPLMDMITNRLASLSDCPVELVHSIIRRRTAKFSEAEQLQKEARFIFQHREDNAFRKYFVDSVKYPYTPKQLHILSRKCAVLLLGLFKKIYQARYWYSLIINSSNNINTYKLYSLGYEITDRHLPRGFVTSRKPFTTTLCDYLNCNCIDYSDCGKVLACGHGYHNQCLEKCQFKCLICLDYLKDEIKKNVDALKVSLVKKLGDNEFIDERRENIVEDNIDNVEIAAGDTTIEELEFAKKSFLEL
ncbi:hypothetical protein C2G38_2047129 [Gigaspora rosea]|uniref:Uncharacterized protein n=1 Tax=Gigaspora rosea TaxID=44941 RepID=A0A397U6Y5_9GLOM|nr:hypothetical protein C2G38_2047129 [Gigaspora rosea]